ncbi:P-loop containing nucleoside triphosphate hydrolase protein [Lophiotrema nucula]|uniref:P-loop containing nucleoside triphosphate hydrolase protein n=1 Tax=Lophiotrema nucula TaxID=690887 RepID=A0A6A5YQ65_9PLEO|nr:P-loop containing nucleoside triphosphate hydrolase protein [Lophiotrema nucula]
MKTKLRGFHQLSINKPRALVLHILKSGIDTACLQAPSWTRDVTGRLQLKAELPLVDGDHYLKRNTDVAFIVRRIYSASPTTSCAEPASQLDIETMPLSKPSQEYIEIRSEEMGLALTAFLKSQQTFAKEFPRFSVKDPLSSPYLFWYRYRKNTEALQQLSSRYREMMNLLTEWIDEHYQSEYIRADELIDRGYVSYNTMPFMFRTSDVVISKDEEHLRTFILDQSPSISRDATGRSHETVTFESLPSLQRLEDRRVNVPWRWQLPCWAIGYEGQFFKAPTILTLEFKSEAPDSEVQIRSLNVYPLRLATEATRLLLRERGKMFWSCRNRRLVAYRSANEDALEHNSERYMIDFASYKTLHLDQQGTRRTLTMAPRDQEPILIENAKTGQLPSAPELYMFPPTIFGFSFRRKNWVDLEVDRITDVVWNKGAFSHLVADQKTKELVQALVANRIAGDRNTDLIQGKGNGLIMLLHGGPGTGKTFTVESVAEMAEKPLYPVTCGDIGTEPEQVEKYLESVLHLGKIWDCVVLLDEADVFLEERSMADLARNALVSVFLRVLEYYDGILILTSNRVGTFDEAFKSRIQLALHYPSLNKSQRCRIWKNFIGRLKDLKEPDIDFDDIECSVLELADEDLNGRQIRNAITIGRQLAKFQGKTLSYEHLSLVIKVSGQFETYAKNTKEGLSDDQVARASGIR